MNTQGGLWMIPAVALLAGAGQTRAATIAWDGGLDGTGKNWNEAANWSGDVKPGAGDTAELRWAVNPNVSTVIALGAPQTVGTVSFPAYGNEPTVTIGSGGDVAAGNTLTLMGSVFRADNVGNWQSFACDITLGADTDWEIRPGYNSGVAVSGGIGGGAYGLSKWGNGTLELQGTNTYTGNTAVNTGTLRLNFDSATAPEQNMVSASSNLKLNGGALTVKAKSSASRSQTFNTLTVQKGASSTTIESASGANMLLTFGAIARTNGATLNLKQPTGNTSINASNGYTTSQANDASGILGAFLTVMPENGSAPADWAANNGGNIVAYTGYTTLAGDATNIADGATSNVRISNASTGIVYMASSGTTTVNNVLGKDTAARTVSVGGGNTLRLGAVGGVLTPSGTGALTISGGTLTAGGADDTAGEIVFVNATTVTNSAVIADNGTGAVMLTKSGGGNLVLTAATTHTGGTYLNAGGLILPGGANPLVPSASLTVSGGTLNLGGGTQTNTVAFLIRGGVITNGTLVRLGSNIEAQGGTVYAVLAGDGGLIKTSFETLALNGNNTYTGDTVVAQGALSARDGAIDGNLIVGSPDCVLPASFSGTSGSIADSKNVTVYTNGNFTANSSENYNNLTIIGGAGGNGYINGTIYMTGGRLTGSLYGGHKNYTIYASDETARFEAYNAMNTYGNHTFSVADGTATIDLKLSGSMAGSTTGYTITKSGAGTMQVTSTGNSFGFKTFNLTGGTLLADNASGSALGNTPAVVGAGTTLGGTGFIGGVATYGNANVSATGSVAGSTTNAAVLAPGTLDAVSGAHVIGTLTVGNLAVQTNNVTFGAHSRLKINIDASGACDRLVVNGTLSLATDTDTLELAVADADALSSGTYNLVTFQQLASAGQTFDTVVGLPSRGRLEYTATGINYVIFPAGTLIRLL